MRTIQHELSNETVMIVQKFRTFYTENRADAVNCIFSNGSVSSSMRFFFFFPILTLPMQSDVQLCEWSEHTLAGLLLLFLVVVKVVSPFSWMQTCIHIYP